MIEGCVAAHRAGDGVERRRVFDFGADGGGDCVDLRAEEQVAD